jgi:hypothetical protein
MEFAINSVEITGGTTIACFNVTSGGIPPVDMQKILEFQSPNAEFSIAARVTSGSASEMTASPVWKEDL